METPVESQNKRPVSGIIIGLEVVGIVAMIGLLVYQKYMAPKSPVAQKNNVRASVQAEAALTEKLFELPELTPAPAEQAAEQPAAETKVAAEQPETAPVAAAQVAQAETAPVAQAAEQPETAPVAKVAEQPAVTVASAQTEQPKPVAVTEPVTPDSPEINEQGGWQISAQEIKAGPNTAASGPPLPKVIKKPKIVVTKSKQILEVYDGDKLLRTYLASTGTNPGDKEKSGDRKTPEGTFYVCVKNPKSRFVLSLGLSYPSYDDAKRGLRDKLINQTEYNHIVSELNMKRQPPWNTKLGGEVMIHGVRQGGRATAGCIALENDDIRELYPRIPHGTKVIVKP